MPTRGMHWRGVVGDWFACWYACCISRMYAEIEMNPCVQSNMAEHTSVNDDGGNSSNDNDVGRNPDLEEEIYYMKQALSVAREALSIGEVPVGCVIVLRDGSIIEPSIQQSKCNDTTSLNNNDGCIRSPSVIVSHGANQVNATRDATRHAEMVAIDRMLTLGRSSDRMKLSSDIICKSAHGKNVPQSNKVDDEKWINIPQCKNHWKNTFGWGSGRVVTKEIFSQCDLYVTCEPCIMVRKTRSDY